MGMGCNVASRLPVDLIVYARTSARLADCGNPREVFDVYLACPTLDFLPGTATNGKQQDVNPRLRVVSLRSHPFLPFSDGYRRKPALGHAAGRRDDV